MKFKTLITVFALSLVATLMLFFSITSKMKPEPLDLVAVNDIVMTAGENWDNDMNDIVRDAENYGMEIAVLNDNGRILSASESLKNITLDNAIANRNTICDIVSDNSIVGKIVIRNNQAEVQDSMLHRIELVLLGFTVVVIITATLYLIYINNSVIKPFNKLNSFAMSVASGNLNVPVTMDRRNIFGAFTESFDIMREELNRAREGQRRADKSKKELVASLSHDIKTPLASIKAMAELMSVSDSAALNKEKSVNIVKKADQIEQLINNLFVSTLEELEQLKVTPDYEPSTIISEMIHNADYNHKVRDFSIPECEIYCDRLRLQQVFDNIVTNSYKYANTDISIETELISTHLLITVRDYGNGVNDNELPFIKQNFYRGSNAAKATGTGIGLYISDYIMKAMDGEIIADNTDNGFAVTVSIKLA